MPARIPTVGSLRDVAAFRRHLADLGLDLPCRETLAKAGESPLGQPLELPSYGGRPLRAANRFVIHPMEGWDGERDGSPSELTTRRWRNFGRSGAGWIWGGEAVAVEAQGRANPRQLFIHEGNAAAFGKLREDLLAAARERECDDAAWAPIVGLQLTHSGRWSSPEPGRAAPRVAFRHPLLDRRAGVQSDAAIVTDREVENLIRSFARAAQLAQDQGFDFVDLKHCHGYLLHEFLAARSRPGRYGGSALEDRARLIEELIAAARDAAPGLALGVRLSVFDLVPYVDGRDAESGEAGPGVPEPFETPYVHGFGVDANDPTRIDLTEPIALVRRLAEWGVGMINVTGGSPYYAPHIQRPAFFPPSDGYAPPEDPLRGVARLLGAARAIKQAAPELAVVSTGWSYLQEYLPHVAEACLDEGWFDAVGLGRMALAYPELPADALAGRGLDRRRLCRTFSDCTTAPRSGFVSGCYPLDPFYRERPEREAIEAIKKSARKARA